MLQMNSLKAFNSTLLLMLSLIFIIITSMAVISCVTLFDEQNIKIGTLERWTPASKSELQMKLIEYPDHFSVNLDNYHSGVDFEDCNVNRGDTIQLMHRGKSSILEIVIQDKVYLSRKTVFINKLVSIGILFPISCLLGFSIIRLRKVNSKKYLR